MFTYEEALIYLLTELETDISDLELDGELILYFAMNVRIVVQIPLKTCLYFMFHALQYKNITKEKLINH